MKLCIIHSDIAVARADIEGEWGDSCRIVPRSMGMDAYSMAHDPYVLASDEAISICLVTEDDQDTLQDADAVVVPYRVTPEMRGTLLRLIEKGTPVYWAKPDPETLSMVPGLFEALSVRRTLLSNQEAWQLAGKDFLYPQMLEYDVMHVTDPDAIAACGRIGQHDSLFRYQNLRFSAAEDFCAFEWYRASVTDTISPDSFMSHFSAQYAALLCHLMGQEAAPHTAFFDLRRDFHAYGYTRLMLAQLAALLEKDISADLCRADERAKDAAVSLVCHADEAACREKLQQAYDLLYAIRQQLTALPVYFAPAHHGGILFENFGFAEFDSPEYMKQMIDRYLLYVKKFGYRFSLDVGVSTWENMAKRYPEWIRQVKAYWESGSIELLNGSYAQQYPYFFSAESNIRQFEIGQQVIRQLFDRPVKTFVSQEFALTPSLPGILNQFAYDAASHRVQHTGVAPMEKESFFCWQGADGSRIPALASHFDQSEKTTAGRFYVEWPQLMMQTLQAGYPYGVYTDLLDLMWVSPFHEETIRSCAYAPILGKFVTYRDLMKLAEPDGCVREYTRNDYTIGPFLDHFYTAGYSGFLEACENAERFLLAAEKLLAVTGKQCPTLQRTLAEGWKTLCSFQNHDSFSVSGVLVGSLTRHLPGMPSLNRMMTLEMLGFKEIGRMVRQCKAALADAMNGSDPAGEPETYLFNPNAFDRTDYLFVTAEDTTVSIRDLQALSSVKEAWKARLSPFAVSPLTNMQKISAEPQQQDGYTIENDCVRVSVDPVSGELTSILDKKTGREYLCEKGSGLRYGKNGRSDCRSVANWQYGDLRQLVLTGQIFDEHDQLMSCYTNYITLVPGSGRICFHTILHPIVRQPDYDRDDFYGKLYPENQWDNSVRMDFAFRCETPDMMQRWLNIVGRENCARFQSLHAVQVVDAASDFAVSHYNTGNQHYEAAQNTLSNILWHSREPRTDYRYALEIPCAGQTAANPSDYLNAFLEFSSDSLPKAADAPAFVSVDTADVEISSMRRDGDRVLLRLENLCGQEKTVCLRFAAPVVQISEVNGYGEPLSVYPASPDGSIRIPLKKWGTASFAFETI